MYLRLEGLVQDHVAWVVLDVLPAGIAMPGVGEVSRAEPASQSPAHHPTVTPWPQTSSLLIPAAPAQLPQPREASLPPALPGQRLRDNSCQQPVVMSAVPDVVDFARRHGSPLLILPQRVQLCGSRSRRETAWSGSWAAGQCTECGQGEPWNLPGPQEQLRPTSAAASKASMARDRGHIP